MLRNASRGEEPKGQALLRMPFRGAAGPHFRAWCSHGKVIKSYWEIEHRIVHLGLEKERIFLETVPTHDAIRCAVFGKSGLRPTLQSLRQQSMTSISAALPLRYAIPNQRLGRPQ